MYVTELFIDLKSSKKSFLPVLLALDESGIYQKILQKMKQNSVLQMANEDVNTEVN